MSAHPRLKAFAAKASLSVLSSALLAAALATTLAACGGGTSQLEPFKATRVLAFGDEASLLLPDGRKYSVNALDDAGAQACANGALWVQAVATVYSFVFPQCNPAAVASPQGVMRATLGAKADDLKTQVDAQVAGGGFAAGDLATVMVGANDVLELAAQVSAGSLTEAAATAELRLRGERAAQQVNRMVDLGARVIVATSIDVGLSPFALAQGTDAAALITRLVLAINGRVRVNILNDGRFVGLVLADEAVQAAARAPGVFGLANATQAACATALPDCTTNTMVTGAVALNWLWADATRIGPGLQIYIGNLAAARARGNPF